MNVEIQVSAKNLVHAIARLERNFGVDVDKAIEVQMGLVLVRVQKWTPPHRGKGGITKKDINVGEAAVSIEMQRVYMLPSKAYQIALRQKNRAFARRLYKALMEGDITTAREMTIQVPGLAALSVANSPDPSVHSAARDSRGKVPKRFRPKQLIASARDLKQQIISKQAHVSKAKKGWEAGIDATGRKSSARIKMTQGTRGSYRKPKTGQGTSALATNDAPSIGSLENRLVNTSLQAQTRALNNQIQGALRHAGRREGLMKQYGQ